MLTRILTAIVLLPFLAAVYLAPAWLFLAIATATGMAVTWEALRLHEARGVRPLRTAALAAVVLLNVSFHDPAHLPPESAVVIGLALVVAARFLSRSGVSDALESLAATSACVLAPGLLLAFQVGIRRLPDASAGRETSALLLFLYAAVFGHDAGAYFVGRAWGRVRLAPDVSPNKTVEGLLGGIVVGTALAMAIAAWLLPDMPTWHAALLAFLLSMAAVLGDLTVSLWKRSAGVKDAGSLLPGHGGFLDRLAGLLWASPLLYMLLTAEQAVAAAGGPAIAGAPCAA